METSARIPAAWAALDSSPPLFASALWLDAMADRIEGCHEWFVHEPGTPRATGLFGTVISDSSVSEAKNPWRLLFEPCTVRSLTETAVAEQAAARSDGPTRDHWFPALVLAYPGLECFALGPGRGSPGALDETVVGVVAHARSGGLRCVAFLYVQPEDAALPAALRRAGFVEFPVTLRANLRLPGRSFPDYLATLGGQRRKVGYIRRQLARQGVSTARLVLSEASDDDLESLVALRLGHREKYGRRPDAEGERAQLRIFRSRFGARVTVYAAVADETMISFGLFLDAGPVQHAWMNGADYEDPRSRFTYFEVAFHAPIEAAYQQGPREFSFGYGAEEAKLQRGCRLDEVSAFVLPLDPASLPAARRAAAALRSGLIRPERPSAG